MEQEIVAAIGGGIALIAAAIGWGIREIFKKLVFLLSELKPNGGSSMKDQVTRLEAQHQRLDTKVDKLYELLLDKLGK
jgi:hypothetical protein